MTQAPWSYEILRTIKIITKEIKKIFDSIITVHHLRNLFFLIL